MEQAERRQVLTLDNGEGFHSSGTMSRPWRVEFAGACYHVINRGNYRRNLFLGKGAAEAFERTLGEAGQRFGWRVHAYVVMSNQQAKRRHVLTLDKLTCPA